MTSLETTGRFMRPIDVRSTSRNRRRVQARRLLLFLANLTLIATLAAGAGWAYQRTQRDARFAVKSIETTGLRYASRQQVEGIAGPYVGSNLFQLDIHRLQQELGSVPWIERAALEKKLPDTLRVEVFERVPAAIVELRGERRYIDEHGVIFAPLESDIDNDSLPRIRRASAREAAQCVEFLRELETEDPVLFGRIRAVEPAGGESGFRLALWHSPMTLSVDPATVTRKWRLLDRILAAEGLSGSDIEYADLRFNGQIVIKKMAREQSGGEAEHGKDR